MSASYKLRARAFRESVSNYLTAVTGHPFASRPNGPDASQQADITGSPRWAVNARTDVARRDLGTAAKRGHLDALADGKALSVTVWRRPGYGIEDSFAVLSLEALGRILAEEARR